jgi:hypothetical protein
MRFSRSMARPRRWRGAGRAEERSLRDCRARYIATVLVVRPRVLRTGRSSQNSKLYRESLRANGLILRPPFTPVPFWRTRTIMPSMIAYSKSGSPDKASKRLSNAPFKVQRRKRRLSAAGRPRSPGLAARKEQSAPVASPSPLCEARLTFIFSALTQISRQTGIPSNNSMSNGPSAARGQAVAPFLPQA